MKTKRLQVGVLAGVLILLGVVAWQRQAITDWWHLRGYIAPAAVAQLATEDTMTPEARHLLYVNHPNVTNGSAFTKNCPAGGEKTVVLGCYVGSDAGIYIYAVSDPRLNGVEQVTAAHEVLHAAYRRLSSSERRRIDALLTDYYQHDLTDQRIKDTIEAYKKSEPNDVVNEMHSVFGTEVANLPPALESYYTQYFTDRSKIAAYAAAYQAEFTGRQQQVSDYDARLAGLKGQIDNDESQLTQQKAALDAQSAQLQADRNSGQTAQYNAAVPGYNRAVDAYNALADSYRAAVDQYNGMVDQRNAAALEENQLTREITAKPTP